MFSFAANGKVDIFACDNGYGNKNYCAFAAGHVINRIAGDSDYGNRIYDSSAPDVTFDGVFYFLEKDLQKGVNINIHFTKFTTPTPFLPRNIANSLPFSSDSINFTYKTSKRSQIFSHGNKTWYKNSFSYNIQNKF